MLQEFWHNFTHNLFKPLLLFFYFGFLIPILKVRFEFPYVLYQGLTMYLLLAIGWHGGEELAKIQPSSIAAIVGFMVLGFVLELPDRRPGLSSAELADFPAKNRPGNGRRILRVRLGGNLCHLRGRPGRR